MSWLWLGPGPGLEASGCWWCGPVACPAPNGCPFIYTGALTGALLASALIAAACHFAAVGLETAP
ncbi:hypothetical protein [Azospirillum sp.]|uniref:hypothetical protein n=1 Tax=Azospirillum sp. TaxID=34012 RepID=UPI002D5C20B2|nr:hypothetical protein [Azospirillum sp.]HYD67101.1 hypothetical protein [Azospirillum sp.]